MWEKRRIAPLILNWSFLYPCCLVLMECAFNYPHARRLNEFQCQARCFGGKKNFIHKSRRYIQENTDRLVKIYIFVVGKKALSSVGES